MTLDPQRKFKLVDDIATYIHRNFTCTDYDGFTSRHNTKIKIILDRFGIKYSGNYFNSDDLLLAEDDKINDLAEYLLNDNGLSHLFHDKYAIEVLATEVKFSNLNLYIHECFECIKSDRNIATAILLRCCVEILIEMCGYKERTLAANIDKFIELIDKDVRFEIFSKYNKQTELKDFLEGMKDFGNGAAHLNGKSVKDFIEKYENKELLKLFCILIEHSILKDGIKKRNEEDVETRVKSIDFTIKERFNKVQEQVTVDSIYVNDHFSINDDIPF